MTLVVGISTLFETRLADDANGLWLLEDEAFVDAVLNILVESPVTADKRTQFVLLLRSGFSKHHVLAEIADQSKEYFRAGRLPGINRRLGQYRLVCRPVVGSVIRWLLGLPSDSPSERRLRIIENQLYLLAKTTFERVGGAHFPFAPWGGIHRLGMLQELIEIEGQMEPSVKASYVALLEGSSPDLPSDLES
ncbi:hypothetical protein [Ferribacterium limneticum]|uniref:hypothetical protein n=1 Tax=Ferribacterium limneticum TaxID=76259 RepID=UPI001CFB8DD9|nr:hypothetical protein [Ferribacterium limneticum]UCV20759.1 hypothetical protein KI610_09415 [Ferribacterium limneticum]